MSDDRRDGATAKDSQSVRHSVINLLILTGKAGLDLTSLLPGAARSALAPGYCLWPRWGRSDLTSSRFREIAAPKPHKKQPAFQIVTHPRMPKTPIRHAPPQKKLRCLIQHAPPREKLRCLIQHAPPREKSACLIRDAPVAHETIAPGERAARGPGKAEKCKEALEGR